MPDESVAKISQRNYRVLSLEGTFYNAGLAFLDANAVLPIFIYTYTKSMSLTGLATTIAMAVPIITQILLGPYLNSIRHIPAFLTRTMLILRPLILLIVPILLSDISSGWVVVAFFIAYGVVFLGQGLLVIPWMKLLAQTVQTDQRNRVFGNQQLLGGIAALAAGSVVKLILNQSTWTEGLKFSLIFGSSGVVFLLTGITMLFSRDLPCKPQDKTKLDHRFYRDLPQFIGQNKRLRQLIIVRAINTSASLITPLLILFGRNHFALAASAVSTLILIQIGGSLLGGLVWRTISSRLGNRMSILVSQWIALTIASLAIGLYFINLIPSAQIILGLLILLNGINMGSWSGFVNFNFDISDDSNRTAYILATNIVLFPLTFVSLLGGILAASIGFLPLFLVCAFTAALGIVQANRLPRV